MSKQRNFIKKIKTRMPVSSRLFHSFSYEFIDGQRSALNEIQALSRQVSVLQKQVALYSEVLLGLNFPNKRGGADSFETRVKLFACLPEATGTLRFCQNATAKLMSKLHNILSENNLEYWFGYGSLLGVFTRGGFIPWDDDVDICMCRQDLEKLQEILKKDKDFQVTVVYDWYAKCIQYRFCSTDINLPVFIDIGVWDYATGYSVDKNQRLIDLRLELMNEFEKLDLPYWEKEKMLIDPGSGYNVVTMLSAHPDEQKHEPVAEKEVETIRRVFEKYLRKAYREGIFCDKTKAESYAYSLDNMHVPGRQMLYKKDIIYPTKLLPYEEFKVRCPNESKAFLNTCYSSWPYIPNDSSLIEGTHLPDLIINDPAVKSAMQAFINS